MSKTIDKFTSTTPSSQESNNKKEILDNIVIYAIVGGLFILAVVAFVYRKK